MKTIVNIFVVKIESILHDVAKYNQFKNYFTLPCVWPEKFTEKTKKYSLSGYVYIQAIFCTLTEVCGKKMFKIFIEDR